MPGRIALSDTSRKRKRPTLAANAVSLPRKVSRTESLQQDPHLQDKILQLEEKILESREHYNNIVELQELVNKVNDAVETATAAAVALCRVFCRLIASDELVKRETTDGADRHIAQWLGARLSDYVTSLVEWLVDSRAAVQRTAITLLMRIARVQVSKGSKSAYQAWSHEKSTFAMTVKALLTSPGATVARHEFVATYAALYDDVCHSCLTTIKRTLQHAQTDREALAGMAIDMLKDIDQIPDADGQLGSWLADESTAVSAKVQSVSIKGLRKAARDTWLQIFHSPLSRTRRKDMLEGMEAYILPWFVGHVELLADFLTDSFNAGGSMSLLALSGIFHLMTQRNLEYEGFYNKLYSLLDEDLLHSKLRSHFFRSFETFMASSHLPAAMVASFMKRLSRLALRSRPGAAVWIVPWAYNMLKQHPPCTFMLHRTYHPGHAIYTLQPRYEEVGMDDPFDMTQPDPMLTGAIDSSLWELETLRTHYHPNVATLARIIGEQFTKQEYQSEDFSDHSYASLIEAELGKGVKKAPVVEWEIPKRIFTSEGGTMTNIGTLLRTSMSGGSE